MSNLSENKGTYVAMGIILGAVAGTLLFIFTNQAWYIGAGAGIGIVFGAILERSRKGKSESTNST